MSSLDDLVRRVATALASLSFRERETIKLRYGLFDGYVYSAAEIALIWEKDAPYARSVLRRSLRKLAKNDPSLTVDALRVLHAAGCIVMDVPHPDA